MFATMVAWSCRSLTNGEVVVAIRAATVVLGDATLTQEPIARNGSASLTRAPAAYPAPQAVQPV